MKPTLAQAVEIAKTYFAAEVAANEIEFEVAEGFIAYISKEGRVSVCSLPSSSTSGSGAE